MARQRIAMKINHATGSTELKIPDASLEQANLAAAVADLLSFANEVAMGRALEALAQFRRACIPGGPTPDGTQAVQINVFGPTDHTCAPGQSEEETCCGESGNPPAPATPAQVRVARELREWIRTGHPPAWVAAGDAGA